MVRNYDKCNCCPFDFLPGVAGGIYPDIRQVISMTFLPFTNLVVWQATTSCFVVSSAKCKRTLASEMLVASAMSLSDRSPCFFRYCRISFILSLPRRYIFIALCAIRGGIPAPPQYPPKIPFRHYNAGQMQNTNAKPADFQNSDPRKSKKPPAMDGLNACFVSGSPTWTRTRDLRINSPSLYRLSYQGMKRCA